MGHIPQEGAGKIPFTGLLPLFAVLAIASLCLTASGAKPPATGSLQVTSLPAGAEVFIDDVPSGLTPVVIIGIAEGVHNIRISLSGYEDYTGLVNVRSGTQYPLTVTLTPVPTTVPPTTVTTVPTTTVPTTEPTTVPPTTVTTVPTTTMPTVPPTSPTETSTTIPFTSYITTYGTAVQPLAPVLAIGDPLINGMTITVNGQTTPGTQGTTIDRIRWDWGDGSVEEHDFPAMHTYYESGSYQLTVSSHQSDGLSTIVHKTITVKAVPPSNQNSTGNGSGTDTNGTPLSTGPSLSLYNAEIYPMSVTINGAVVPGTAEQTITRIVWDWGDGNQTEYLGFPNSHGYSSAGMYTIRVIAYQSNGQSVTRSVTVQVEKPPVSPNSTSPGTQPDQGIPPVLYVVIVGIGVFGGILYWKRDLLGEQTRPGPETVEKAVEDYHRAKERWDLQGAKESAKESARLFRQLSKTDPTRREAYLEKAGVWDTIARTIEEQKEQVFLLNDLEQIESSEHLEHLLADEDFGALLSGTDVDPGAFTAVLRVAAEISREGREGKRVGTAFVIGDLEQVLSHSTQIVLNPFKGHAIEDRRITDPNQWENIKEFAQLDGAFVIGADGIVEAAGRYLTADTSKVALPKGMGSRHVSIAGITQVTNSIGVVVSQSGGLIRVFRNGTIMKTIIP